MQIEPARGWRLRICAIVLLALTTGASADGVTYTDLYTLGAPSGVYASPRFSAGAAVGGQMIGSGITSQGFNNRAILWTPANPTGIDLTPDGDVESYVEGTNGTQQVGYAQHVGDVHAIAWSGSASAYVDLHPTSNFISSYAYGTDGANQVGYGFFMDGGYHALLWSGSASSYVDLDPNSVLDYSIAVGVVGNQQVGYGHGAPTGGATHALLWSGTAGNFVDLNPAGFDESFAFGTSGTQQVGYGDGAATNGEHALLWTGSAGSYVDLNPSAFTASTAYATDGTRQVGYGLDANFEAHALLWYGSADDYLDLSSVLPAGYLFSEAYSISGNTIYGVAEDGDGNYHAVEWNVPEPASVALLVLSAGMTLLAGRNSRHRLT